jgi:hypothetical protein
MVAACAVLPSSHGTETPRIGSRTICEDGYINGLQLCCIDLALHSTAFVVVVVEAAFEGFDLD